MDTNCQRHKSKAILFCIDDKCCKPSRYLCSKCENNNEHENHQLELIEEIPKKMNRCILQDVPLEKLLISTKHLIAQITQRLNNMLQRYEEQLCLYIKEECSKIGNLLSKGKTMLQSNFHALSVQDQDLFIELANNRIGYDQTIQNVKQRQIFLEQSLSSIQQNLNERLTLSTFRKIRSLQTELEFISNFQSKSFCMLNEDQFVVGEDDGSVKLFDIERSEQVTSIELKSVVSNFTLEKISSTQVAAYEKLSYYLEIIDFNALQGKNCTVLKNKDQISCLKSIVLGEIFAIGHNNGLLKVYNYKQKEFVQKLDCNIEKLNVDMSISCLDSLNSLVVAAGKSGFIIVWNWRNGALINQVKRAFTNDDLNNKDQYQNDLNKGRGVKRIMLINEKEILVKMEGENSFQFYSLNHENQQQYPLCYINVIRFLQPPDYQSIIVKKPVFSLPLDFETFTNEHSRDNILFVQKDYRKVGRYLQIYNHSTNKIKFSHYFERNSEIVGCYLTSKHLIVVYQDGVIEAYV